MLIDVAGVAHITEFEHKAAAFSFFFMASVDILLEPKIVVFFNFEGVESFFGNISSFIFA